jgi:hypothetical protein
MIRNSIGTNLPETHVGLSTGRFFGRGFDSRHLHQFTPLGKLVILGLSVSNLNHLTFSQEIDSSQLLPSSLEITENHSSCAT